MICWPHLITEGGGDHEFVLGGLVVVVESTGAAGQSARHAVDVNGRLRQAVQQELLV